MTNLPEWRYFPELLRDLERVPGGAACAFCSAGTETLRGPRADLAWCPRCRMLTIAEHGGGRVLGVFSATALPTGAAATAEPARAVEPSEVPRLRAPPRPTNGLR